MDKQNKAFKVLEFDKILERLSSYTERQTVDEKSRQQRIESEKAEKESDKNKDTDSAESTEAPAETESADATEAPNA